MKRAALVGFHHVTPLYVDRLLKIYVLKKDLSLARPKLHIECCALLVVKTIPNIDPSSLKLAMSYHIVEAPKAPLISGSSELADSLYDSSDKKELKSCAEKYMKQTDEAEVKKKNSQSSSMSLGTSLYWRLL